MSAMEYVTHTGFQRTIDQKMNESGKDNWFLHTFMPAGMAETPDGAQPIFVAVMQRQILSDGEIKPARNYIGMNSK